MSWQKTVLSQAEQVVEHLGLSAENPERIAELGNDPLFQELALAHHRAANAEDVALGHTAGVDDLGEEWTVPIGRLEDELLELLRDRATAVLLEAGLLRDGRFEEGSA